MEKNIALGCSLTAQDGYVNDLKSNYGFDILNLAVSAGSNQLQELRLQNCLIEGLVSFDTTLIWQLTNPTRYFEIVSPVDKSIPLNGVPFSGSFDWIPDELSLFNTKTKVLLTNNKHFSNYRIPDMHGNLQNTIVNIYKWSFLVNRIVVFYGWNFGITDVNEEQIKRFLQTRPNIQVLPLEDSILDWCKNKNLALADSNHPMEDSYREWGRQILLPYLIN